MATPKRSAFATEATQPRLVQAVSLALAILRTTKKTRWEQLQGVIPWEVALLPGQLELLSEHAAELLFIRSTGTEPDGTKVATVSVAVCPDCGLWQLLDKTPPRRCQLTIGCTGAPVKASAAVKASVPTGEEP